MITMGWIFWVFTGLFALISMYYGIRVALYGATYTRNPTWWWVGPWNLIGVLIVLLIDWSPWHLLWWWPLGLLAAGIAKAVIWGSSSDAGS